MATATAVKPSDPQYRPSQWAGSAVREKRKVSTTDDLHRRRHQNSLKRTKDSTDELRTRARSRSVKNSTSTTSSNARHHQDSGRQFTVANIGNNGIIYLRPVARPATQRSTRPPPTTSNLFSPVTTDGGVPSYAHASPPAADHDLRASYLSTSIASPTFSPRQHRSPPVSSAAALRASNERTSRISRPRGHIRSHSFSTLDECQPLPSPDPDSFRIVIDRPATSSVRPKSADDDLVPQLQVAIPHYRLGTPRFSARGTAILRSSVYTRASGADTEDFRSSVFSGIDVDRLFPFPPGMTPPSYAASRRFSDAFHHSLFRRRTDSTIGPSSARTSTAPISPQIYEPLLSDPDNNNIVRFSVTTGDITAATPSRLIAHITSANFLDYELLSDFFLTFRAFLTTHDLTEYLIARLRWSVNRKDDCGRIIRVRTFVALRHWILNYFVDDFLPDIRLRVKFCELVNKLYGDLRSREDGGAGDINIVGELKKCWRRTCALYWEDPESLGLDIADRDILPGEPLTGDDEPGEEVPIVMPSEIPLPNGQKKPKPDGLNFSEIFKNKPLPGWRSAQLQKQHSLTSGRVSSTKGPDGVPLSPQSELSVQILSCSIPMKPLNRGDAAMEIPLYPHPVPVPASIPTVASPKTSSAKAPHRSGHAHKRSGSFSDALRDHRAPLPQPKSVGEMTKEAPTQAAPGSIIQGAVFQPDSPYVELRSPSSVRSIRSQYGPETEATVRIHQIHSPGVKKFLGSVRRALSSKQPGSHSSFSSTHSIEPPLPPVPVRDNNHSTTSCGTTVSTHLRTRSRPRVRIDILAARIEESFKDAVAQQAEEDRKRQPQGILSNGAAVQREAHQGRDPMDALRTDALNLKSPHSRFHSNVTSASRSIVIVDDTQPMPDHPSSPRLFMDPEPTLAPEQLEQYTPVEETEEATKPAQSISVAESGVLPRRQSFDSSGILSNRKASTSQALPFSKPLPLRTSKSMHRPSKSIGATSLRKMASYQSGVKHMRGKSFDSVTPSTVPDTPSDYQPFGYDKVPTPPTRQLRRRPGGNLKGVNNVHDLEPIPRPASTGSVSNRTHSVTNSVVYSSMSRSAVAYETSQTSQRTAPDSTKEVVSAPLPKRVSLMNTHSSQPNLRPSFEAEVAKLAALPDDVEDDGGRESTLLKLEGKYEKKSPVSSPSHSFSEQFTPPPRSDSLKANIKDKPLPPIQPAADRHDVHTYPKQVQPSQVAHVGMHPLPGSAGRDTARRPTITGQSVASEESYNSVPILERGLSDVITPGGKYSGSGYTISTHPSARPLPLDTAAARRADSSPMPEPKEKPLPQPREESTMFKPPTPRESFLLDQNQDLSDMASEISSDHDEELKSFYDDESHDGANKVSDPLSHPLRHPPTPPATSENQIKQFGQQETQFRTGLPTPGITPTVEGAMPPLPTTPANAGIESRDMHTTQNTSTTSQLPASHLPYILAYDSQHIAEQMTLIEKDALEEIDWKELIELRWKSTAPPGLTDWVDFLRAKPPPHGVDVVIARFNIMVKWATSECVLTENIEERARVFVKYIHIAKHCRRLRNYATMYQLTVALLSSDVSRLSRTWDLVPASDMRTFHELEALVQPIRNFHNLRLEMETATAEEGCIPFIGIYTRDLIYNAQKPPLLSSPTPAGERLVNFERHHTAAVIVKSLLRLLEASSKYAFQPDPVLASRCLWMAALTDEEITERSKKLEA